MQDKKQNIKSNQVAKATKLTRKCNADSKATNITIIKYNLIKRKPMNQFFYVIMVLMVLLPFFPNKKNIYKQTHVMSTISTKRNWKI